MIYIIYHQSHVEKHHARSECLLHRGAEDHRQAHRRLQLTHLLPRWTARHPQCTHPQKAGGHRGLRHQNRPELLPHNLQAGYLQHDAGVTKSSTLAEHGLDSLDAIEISMQIEEDLGYMISAETLPSFTKVKHYITYIEQVEAFKRENSKNPIA